MEKTFGNAEYNHNCVRHYVVIFKMLKVKDNKVSNINSHWIFNRNTTRLAGYFWWKDTWTSCLKIVNVVNYYCTSVSYSPLLTKNKLIKFNRDQIMNKRFVQEKIVNIVITVLALSASGYLKKKKLITYMNVIVSRPLEDTVI